MTRYFATVVAVVAAICSPPGLLAQRGGEGYGTGPQLITVSGGPGTVEQQVAGLDFAQLMLQQQNQAKEESEKKRQEQAKLVDSGAVSALDLAAPSKAVKEYNAGIELISKQHSPESVAHLEKALTIYPKFVSAHNALGLAYVDVGDSARAQQEFETAVGLDAKFARSLLNLGRLALTQAEYGSADTILEKAAALRPNDAEILTALAYAQEENHLFEQAIRTVTRVHSLKHEGMGSAHYVAAAAGLALNRPDVVERELTLFVSEDPTNALAPVARRSLEQLEQNKKLIAAEEANAASRRSQRIGATESPANTARLRAELNSLGEPGQDTCELCTLGEPNSIATAPGGGSAASEGSPVAVAPAETGWTMRKVINEVALFFAVSSHGHLVDDLQLSEIEVRDDGKAPERVLQFSPQSKLPLRVGLLVDTSGSVQPRFSFEKYAATRFLQQLLTGPDDLGFVVGFSNQPVVMQDFTSSHDALSKGVERLKNGGGTSLFDAVSFACGKLGAYPESERVAKVLVILSDGQDNASHTTLRRAISAAESAEVTVYVVSTNDEGGGRTDADRVLQVLAERTGGEALFPKDNAMLRHSFDKLREIIRSRYLLAYKPADFGSKPRYRSIELTATRNGNKLDVHARRGYEVPASAVTAH